MKQQGVEQSLARFLVYDLDLPRKNYSQVAQHILREAKLKHPDVSVRISAVHYGRTPKKEQVISLGKDVLASIDAWLDVAEKIVGPDYRRMWEARSKMERLPERVADFDREVFDLRVTYNTILGTWVEANT